MNFDQVVIREFLKLNPGLTDTPVLLNKKRVGSVITGAVVFQNNEDSINVGSKEVRYTIPDIGRMFTNITPSIEIYKPTNTRDIAKVFFEKYGIVADVNDIVQTNVAFDPLPLEVELVAITTAMTITGKVKVQLSQKAMAIEDIVTTLDCDAVVDVWPMSMTVPNITKQYYWWDFTRHRAELDTLVKSQSIVGYAQAAAVHKIMTSPDVVAQFGNPGWVCDFSSKFYDLREITIPYVGPPAIDNLGAPGYKRCVVVSSMRHGYTIVFNYDR